MLDSNSILKAILQIYSHKFPHNLVCGMRIFTEVSFIIPRDWKQLECTQIRIR